MKALQILGTGCPRCRELTAAVEEAARRAGIEYRIEKVTDIGRIVEMGAFATPALAVDGEVQVAGRVPPVDEIVLLLGSASPAARGRS
jgi:small redox-active disulfide protein 2